MRTRARRRRCAHHGTASTVPPMTSACGSGEVTGPAAVAAASHPPAASVTVAAYSRSARAGMPAFAPKMASAQAAAVAMPSR